MSIAHQIHSCSVGNDYCVRELQLELKHLIRLTHFKHYGQWHRTFQILVDD